MSFLRQKRIIRKIYWKQSILDLLGALWNSCLLFYQPYSVKILFTHHFFLYIRLVPDFILSTAILPVLLCGLFVLTLMTCPMSGLSQLLIYHPCSVNTEIRPCLADLKAVSQFGTTASEKYTINTNISLLFIVKLCMEWIKNKWIQVFSNIKNNYQKISLWFFSCFLFCMCNIFSYLTVLAFLISRSSKKSKSKCWYYFIWEYWP